MQTQKTLFHIDDSALALRVTGDVLQTQFPGHFKTIQFKSADQALDALEKTQELPWGILCDYNMPGKSGEFVLALLKRHPRFHRIPVIMISADADLAQVLVTPLRGASGLIKKPIVPDQLRTTFEKILNNPPSKISAQELDLAFATESLETFDEGAWQNLSTLPLDAQKVDELYRFLHTVKGGALSVEFPTLGSFVHDLEELVRKTKAQHLYQLPELKTYFAKVLIFIRTQLETIANLKPLDPVPGPLVEELQTWIKTAGLGIHIPDQPAASPATLSQAPLASAPTSSSRAHSTRLSNEKLDFLQAQIKKIVQLRTRLNTYANNLKAEFPDESFPLDLSKMVEELASASGEAMDLLIGLRVLPVAALQGFSENLVQETSRTLQKPVRLHFEFETGLEVDQAIHEALQGALTHILRNAIDHGIESAELRTKQNKPSEGLISISLKNLNKDQFSLSITDDGRGIDGERLRTSLVKKGIMTETVAAQIKPEGLLDLVFVDGLSTREETSEFSGRGVGLGAVKERITKLSGQITVESTPNKGTRFMITMPRIFHL